MNFKCNFCSVFFSEVNQIFSHLRKEHKVIENSERIFCPVNFNHGNSCKKSYLTFSGLRSHIKSCLLSKMELAQPAVIIIHNKKNEITECFYQ